MGESIAWIVGLFAVFTVLSLLGDLFWIVMFKIDKVVFGGAEQRRMERRQIRAKAGRPRRNQRNGLWH